MKLKFSLIMALSILMIVSCGVRRDNVTSEKIDQMGYFSQVKPWQLAESDTHFYHVAGNFLYAISKEDGQIRVLDNNPETLDDMESEHELKEESHAYFMFPRFVFYDHDKLYVVSPVNRAENVLTETYLTEDQDCLFEVSTSGSGQKQLLLATASWYNTMIHDGYFYFSTSEGGERLEQIRNGELTEEEMEALRYRIERVPLTDPNKEPELVFEGKGAYGVCQKMRVISDHLYFSDDPLALDVAHESRVLKCNLDTLEISEVNYGPGLDGNILHGGDDVRQLVRPKNVMASEALLQTLNPDGEVVSESTLVPPINIMGWSEGYGNLVCIDNFIDVLNNYADQRILQFVNGDGVLLDEAVIPVVNSMIMAMTEDYLFIAAPSTSGPYDEIYRLPLDKIGTDEFVLEPFFVYQPKVVEGFE